jgi:hypothetical protein
MADTEITPNVVRTFLRETEKEWADRKIDGDIYGFQFQPGTKWNPGLSLEQINDYQSALGIRFPKDLVTFLQCANGTDLPTINVYGNDGNPHACAPGVYSYPRDLEVIKQRIELLAEDWDAILESLEIGEKILGENPKLFPFFAHRYVLCNGDPTKSIVCSIHGTDAIVYGSSLEKYLRSEFLGEPVGQ